MQEFWLISLIFSLLKNFLRFSFHARYFLLIFFFFLYVMIILWLLAWHRIDVGPSLLKYFCNSLLFRWSECIFLPALWTFVLTLVNACKAHSFFALWAASRVDCFLLADHAVFLYILLINRCGFTKLAKVYTFVINEFTVYPAQFSSTTKACFSFFGPLPGLNLCFRCMRVQAHSMSEDTTIQCCYFNATPTLWTETKKRFILLLYGLVSLLLRTSLQLPSCLH